MNVHYFLVVSHLTEISFNFLNGKYDVTFIHKIFLLYVCKGLHFKLVFE